MNYNYKTYRYENKSNSEGTKNNETYEKEREKRIIKEFLETGILDKEITIQLNNVKEEKDLWCLYTLMRFKQKLRELLK